MTSMRHAARSVLPFALFTAPRLACVAAVTLLSACAATNAQTSGDNSTEGGGFFDGLKKLGNAVSEAGGKVARDAAAGVTAAANGKGNVRGYVPLQNNQTLTCFEHMPSGLISNGGPISDPGQGKAAPIAVMTAKGQLVTGECDKLAQQSLLVPWLPPGGPGPAPAVPVKATVPVFTYKDAEGNTISNAPDNCRIIHVTDANGTFVKKRYLSRQEDYVIASKCETALYDRTSKAVKPQAN